jgi:hypothetical protein
MTDSQLVLNNEVVNGINAQATFELHNTEAPHPTGTTFHINVQDSACVAAEV